MTQAENFRPHIPSILFITILLPATFLAESHADFVQVEVVTGLGQA